MKRVGRYTILLETAPKIAGYASVVGKKEKEGPLGSEFDRSYKDTSLGESSWEKAESRLQKEAVENRPTKSRYPFKRCRHHFCGD